MVTLEAKTVFTQACMSKYRYVILYWSSSQSNTAILTSAFPPSSGPSLWAADFSS